MIAVEPEGLTDRELMLAMLQATQQTHECVHALQREHRSFATETRQARKNTQAALAGIKAEVNTVKKEVGALKTAQDIDSGKVTKLAKVIGSEPWAPGDRVVKPNGIGWWSGSKATVLAFLILMGSIVAGAPTYQFLKAQVVAADAFLSSRKD